MVRRINKSLFNFMQKGIIKIAGKVQNWRLYIYIWEDERIDRTRKSK